MRATLRSLIVGLAKNPRLKRLSHPWSEHARAQYETQQKKQRVFTDLLYKAGTWKRRRRLILKAEHMSQGSNPRHVVTNLAGDAQTLYETVYCARGDMKNRIGEAVPAKRQSPINSLVAAPLLLTTAFYSPDPGGNIVSRD